MQNRNQITEYIASHGLYVVDDNEAWHIVIPYSSPDGGGWETVTARDWREVRAALGY